MFQALLGLCIVLPFAVEASGVDPGAIPWLAGALAVAAATRVMAAPAVNEWLPHFIPWLAAER